VVSCNVGIEADADGPAAEVKTGASAPWLTMVEAVSARNTGAWDPGGVSSGTSVNVE
jgi:hypothetical protein